LRTSAYELYKTIQKTEKNIAQDNINMQFDNFRRNSPWSKEQLEKLSQKLDDLMRKGR
jgi:predicted RNA-binding protein with PIN domain